MQTIIPDAAFATTASRIDPNNYGLPATEPGEHLNFHPAEALRKGSLNAEALQQTLAAEGSVIPLPFGVQRLGALIGAVALYNGELVVLAIWCQGEIEAIDSVLMDDAALPGSITATHYTGTAGQTVNATLAAAIPGYTDAMPNTAYSVFSIPGGLGSGFPRFVAQVRGLKVPLTSGGTPTYTDNPAYIIAALIENTSWGMGRTVDWASVATVAATCDATVGGEKKRLLNLVIGTAQPCVDWLNVLRTYAGCWAVPEGASYRLVADTTGASVMTFTTANILANSLRVFVRGRRQTPTMMEVAYTDTSTTPWRENTASVPTGGATPRRLSRVTMPGITRYSEARRFGIERLNAATLNDMTVQFIAFDEGLQLQVGDLITVTHPCGLTAKVFRATQITPAGPGRWRIIGSEYDAAVYSSEVAIGPSVLDTDWANPAAPPAVGALTVTEEVYQVAIGTYASRLRVTWAAVSWPFLRHYRVTVTSGGAVIDTATVEANGTTYATPAVREAVAYQIDVGIVSTIGAVGAAASASKTPSGKALIPGDVPSLTGFEAGGKVFLSWGPAVDLDIWRYEIRYGLAAGSWATATLIDRIDGLTYQVTGAPAGDWRFYVKAIDSIGQYSTNARTLDLTVTLDSSAFLLGTKVFDDIGAPTLTSMTSYAARPDARTYYATDFGDGVGYGADNTNNSVGTFGDSLVNTVFAHPHTAGTSKYVTPSWDIGQSLTGNFTGSITYADASGTASYWIETSPDDATWTQWVGGSAKTTCRYVRLRLETTGTMIVESGATARVDAYPREETGVVTTSASGASTVSLTFKYATYKSIQLTPKGSTGRQVVFDNPVLSLSGANSFDVYLFAADGTTQLADDVSWIFQGI